MCGRYLIEDEVYADMLELISSIAEHNQLHTPHSTLPVNPTLHTPYSKLKKVEIYPTNIAPVFVRDGVAAVKWGFPNWKNSGVIINARAETAPEKNMFRKPLRESRCVIPSSGFYEWDRVSGRKKKEKYLLRRPGARMLYMAGMMSVFCDAAGCDYSAFVILTTAANDSVAQLHDRMPVILAPDERDRWLGDSGFVQYALRRPGPELELLMMDSKTDAFPS